MGAKKAILVIEDDKDDQEILHDAFQELRTPNPLLFFDDCNKAYNYLMSAEEKPFLILCDINLPKTNGIELKKRIDATDYLRRKATPFVFLTTADHLSTVEEAYRITNLQGYFKKAATLEKIKKQLACILAYWEEALQPGPGGEGQFPPKA